MIICETKWAQMCVLDWQYGSPSLSNKKELKRLPHWLRRNKLPFFSDENCTDLEGYIWDKHYLYKFAWHPGDTIDHLDIYRAKIIDVHKMWLSELRRTQNRLRKRSKDHY